MGICRFALVLKAIVQPSLTAATSNAHKLTTHVRYNGEHIGTWVINTVTCVDDGGSMAYFNNRLLVRFSSSMMVFNHLNEGHNCVRHGGTEVSRRN